MSLLLAIKWVGQRSDLGIARVIFELDFKAIVDSINQNKEGA